MRETFQETHLSCSMRKRAPKKQLIFEKREHFENGQKWPKAIAHAKWAVWVKK